MIKKLFTIGAFIFSGLVVAQDEEQKVITTTTTTTTTTTVTEQPISSIRKNDIMIDPFAILSGIGSVSYERHLNKDMAVGISTFFAGKDYFVGDEKTWYVLPYFRHYMGKRWARGFFFECFAGVVNKEYEYYAPYAGVDPGFCGGICPSVLKKGKETNFRIGFGLGGKWETKKNIVFEVSGGLGRAFSAKNVEAMFGKGMLGIGYRF